jgi:hypothetical protein
VEIIKVATKKLFILLLRTMRFKEAMFRKPNAINKTLTKMKRRFWGFASPSSNSFDVGNCM